MSCKSQCLSRCYISTSLKDSNAYAVYSFSLQQYLLKQKETEKKQYNRTLLQAVVLNTP